MTAPLTFSPPLFPIHALRFEVVHMVACIRRKTVLFSPLPFLSHRASNSAMMQPDE